MIQHNDPDDVCTLSLLSLLPIFSLMKALH